MPLNLFHRKLPTFATEKHYYERDKNCTWNLGLGRMGLDYIDMYWIHNPMDVERWTVGLIPLAQKAQPEKNAQTMNNTLSKVQTVDFSVWPKGVLNPYGQYFTGNSYLAQLDGGLANVTFEPGCRNDWHVHHGAVQVLICVAGRGWYQEWGKPAVPMTPGTVIAIPAETKHWHGAAVDSWFQHLTYHTAVQEGSSNEWLEPVTDEQYNAVN